MRRRIATIQDVAERHLCCGCGVCEFAQPDDISMVDDLQVGRRPVVREGADTALALSCCPGIELGHEVELGPDVDPRLLAGWGPVLEVWEGHAVDEKIRFSGSSGGVATALGLHGLRDGWAGGVIHIRQRHDVPVLNETVMSTNRDDLLRGSGSRYAPASPCDGLGKAVEATRPVAFIGKPCDVAAAQKAQREVPGLEEKLAVTIAIFCAGAPSTAGTIEMLEALGVDDPSDVGELRYRGNGWPGRAAVRMRTGGQERSLSYEESWGGLLQKHRPWRCRLCIDHTGEFADLAVGDPWYREIEPGEAGSSLVVVRTERGRRYLAEAVQSGHLDVHRVPNELLPESQPNLLQTRGAVWGRLTASRLIGLPTPTFHEMPTFRHWIRELTIRQKASSVGGTVRRVLKRGLHRRREVRPIDEATMSAWTVDRT